MEFRDVQYMGDSSFKFNHYNMQDRSDNNCQESISIDINKSEREFNGKCRICRTNYKEVTNQPGNIMAYAVTCNQCNITVMLFDR